MEFERTIEARPTAARDALQEAWARRGVFWSLLLREVQVRYRQAWLGIAWAVLQPLALVVVTTLVFHHVLRIDVSVQAYPLFVLAGLLPWTFFHTSISAATPSLVNNAELVRKIHFPREALPTAAVGAAGLDLLIGVVLWIAALVIYGVPFHATLLWLPFWVVLLIGSALGPALLLAGLNVHARDIKHALPLALQVLFFATPIVYPLEAVPTPWRQVMYLNPLTAVIDGLRRTGLEGLSPRLDATLIGTLVATAVLVAAYLLFLRAGRRFADVV